MLVRLDITVGKLLDYLDKKVGAGKYVVAMSSDHGVADLPEQDPAGGRQPAQTIRAAIETAMQPKFGGDGSSIAAISGGDIYFKPGVYERLRADAATLKAVRSAATALPGVARVFTSEELAPAAARTSKDPRSAPRRSATLPDAAATLTVLVKEHWIMPVTGTTHGTPHDMRQARAGDPVRRRDQAGRS